jgi:hypothetical protein
VAGTSGCDRFVVQRAEVAQIVGDDGSVFGAGERRYFGIGEGHAVGVACDRLHVVSARVQLACDRWAQHLVKEQLHR